MCQLMCHLKMRGSFLHSKKVSFSISHVGNECSLNISNIFNLSPKKPMSKFKLYYHSTLHGVADILH